MIFFSFGINKCLLSVHSDLKSIDEMSIGAVAIMGYMGILQFVISQGATRQAMIYVVLGALLNVVLDPILIFGFDMGVAGAAIATVLSQLLIAVLSIWFLMGKKSSLTLRFKSMKLKMSILAAIITLGFSTFLMQITEAALNVAVNASAQKYGGDISALSITLAVSLSMVIWDAQQRYQSRRIGAFELQLRQQKL